MKTEYILIEITETGRNNPAGECQAFNKEQHKVKTLNDVNMFLIDRYGKKPQGKNKIYIDNNDGTSEEVGFLHSFWNQDISHNSKKLFQTDWITFYKVTKESLS